MKGIALGTSLALVFSAALPASAAIWPADSPSCAPAARQGADTTVSRLFDELRKGGLVLVFRHTHTDRSKMDDDHMSLADRATQRNLSDRGAEEARRIGTALTTLGIPVGEVLASPMFRTRETAELAFGRADTTELLRRRGREDEARALLTRVPADGRNRMLVTHNAYLNRYFQSSGHGSIGEGDAVVVRPTVEGYEVLGRIRLRDLQAVGSPAPSPPL